MLTNIRLPNELNLGFINDSQSHLLALKPVAFTLPSNLNLTLAVVAVVIASAVPSLMIRRRRIEQRRYALVGNFMTNHGWESIPEIPDNVLTVIRESSFLINAPGWDNYTCIHAFKTSPGTLYFGLIFGGGGRTYRKNTPVIFTDQVRTPLECLIVHRTNGFPIRKQFVVPVQNIGSSFVVCFQSDPRQNEALMSATLQIIETVFSPVSDTIIPGAKLVIGPRGLVITGAEPVKVHDLGQSLGILVRDSREWLNRHSKICSEGIGVGDPLGETPLTR